MEEITIMEEITWDSIQKDIDNVSNDQFNLYEVKLEPISNDHDESKE